MSEISVNSILEQVIPERLAPMNKLLEGISQNLPSEFQLEVQYKMISWTVPFSIYPAGYHCDTKLALPFLAVASQKNFISLYHMGLYADPELMDWFINEYPKHVKTKLDIGKSCIRFKKMEDIPYQLINELVKKMSVAKWIELYESKFKSNKK